MFQLSRYAALLVAAVLGYNGATEWYEQGKAPTPVDPTPAPVVVPDEPDPIPTPVTPIDPSKPVTITVITKPTEKLAPAPTSPAIQSASAPIRTIMAQHGNDAIKLARAYYQWADLIGRDSTIKTTDEFQQVYVATLQTWAQKNLSAAHPLNAPTDATIKAAFADAGLTDPSDANRVRSGPFDAAARQAAVNALSAISYQCFQAFLDSSVRQSAFNPYLLNSFELIAAK